MRFYIEFELPSGGHLITPHKGFIGDAEGLEQLERATPAVNQDQIIAELIQKALKENYFNVKNLTSPDFTYLKIMYSIATFGNKLLYPIICPYCAHETKFIALNTLKKIHYNSDNRFIKIPSKESHDFYSTDGPELELRVPTIEEKWNVLLEGDTLHSTVMAVVNSIFKINGKSVSYLEKELFVQDLSYAQKRAILARVDKLADFGIALYQEMVCECGKTVNYPFPVRTRQLFFPQLEF